MLGRPRLRLPDPQRPHPPAGACVSEAAGRADCPLAPYCMRFGEVIPLEGRCSSNVAGASMSYCERTQAGVALGGSAGSRKQADTNEPTFCLLPLTTGDPLAPPCAVVDGQPADKVVCPSQPNQPAMQVTPVVSGPGSCQYAAQASFFVQGESSPLARIVHVQGGSCLGCLLWGALISATLPSPLNSPGVPLGGGRLVRRYACMHVRRRGAVGGRLVLRVGLCWHCGRPVRRSGTGHHGQHYVRASGRVPGVALGLGMPGRRRRRSARAWWGDTRSGGGNPSSCWDWEFKSDASSCTPFWCLPARTPHRCPDVGSAFQLTPTATLPGTTCRYTGAPVRFSCESREACCEGLHVAPAAQMRTHRLPYWATPCCGDLP